MLRPPTGRDWVALTESPLRVEAAVTWATTPASGAVVSFLGVVRDHSEGRPGVVGLTYEAYESAALTRMEEITTIARERWPELERIVLWHRVGDLTLSDVSVVVAVAASHRREAFAAAEYCIDVVKEAVPIWKREQWEGGTDWADRTYPIRSVGDDRHQAEQESA